MLQEIRTQIDPYSLSPYLDALVLLSHITSQPTSRLLAHPSPDLTPDQKNQLKNALNKIKLGVPLPYIVGSWEFCQRSFILTPDVLIPRPETEWLVEKALGWFKEYPNKRTYLDLGTGSGCIAVTLARIIPDLKGIATDNSPAALRVAQKNAIRHQVAEQIFFIASDILNGFQTKVDLLISNLPYIPTEKLKTLPVYQTEPHQALDGGPDGLYYIKEALKESPRILNPGGLILLELDETRGEAALDLAQGYFPEADIRLKQDLSGQDRFLTIQT
jgi:release factor glutamine methyltransferase